VQNTHQYIMDYNYISVNNKEGISSITLNRPKVYNALNSGILKELSIAVKAASENKEIRAILLTGSGEKAFCSGADLKEGTMAGKPLSDSLKENYEPLINGIRNCPKPVVCRLNGVAAGAGMSLALACDLIIADENAYMSELFVGIGLMPDAGSMFFVPRIVGMHRAFEIFSTGRKIYMKEAVEIGLVSKAVPTAELDEQVEQIMSYYASAPTFAIGQMKKVLNQSYQSSLQEVLDMEAEGQANCGFSDDFAEGVMSFLQKRKPEFKGS
jgi:2-(1,2-epoxy-1,2-dihydrophenyl)acetyl-CoA isomerase